MGRDLQTVPPPPGAVHGFSEAVGGEDASPRRAPPAVAGGPEYVEGPADHPGPVIPAPPAAMDEVTLAFATWVDATGTPRTLSESVVQATILCAVSGERSRQRFVFQPKSETVHAVAPVYWPLQVFPTGEPHRFVIFDGSGLWTRSFHHSLLPPLDACRAELSHPPAAPDLPACLRNIRAVVLGAAGSEALTVEGFLPNDVPLFSDIISQSAFRTEPLPAHPGFLPTRHPVDWYRATVSQITRAIAAFDAELRDIRELRAQVERVTRSALEGIATERRRLESELRNRIRLFAHSEMEREAESLHRSIWEQTMADLDRVRQADAAIAGAQAAAATAEELSRRVAVEGGELTAYRDRARKAREVERQARHAIREARERIERLHAREREAFGVLTDRVALVEQRAAHDLAGFDLLQAEVESSSAGLLQALDTQAARRSAERDPIAAHLVELPALEGVQTLWFPLWVAELTGPKGSRFRVYPPMQLRTSVKVGESIKTLFGGMVLPIEARTARFEQALRGTLELALARDPWLNSVMRQIVRTADATADPDVLQRLARGLQELRETGWISHDQERSYFESCAEHLRSRPSSGAPPAAPTSDRPSGALVHGS